MRAEASSVFRGGEDVAQSVLSGGLDHLDRAELERLVGQSAAVQAQLQSQTQPQRQPKSCCRRLLLSCARKLVGEWLVGGMDA